MFCQQCGTELSNDAKFCSRCGVGIIRPTPPQPLQSVPVESSWQPREYNQRPVSSRVYALTLCRSAVMVIFSVLQCLIAVVAVVSLFSGELQIVDSHGEFSNEGVVKLVTALMNAISMLMLAIGACFTVSGGFFEKSGDCRMGLRTMARGVRLFSIEWIITTVYSAVSFFVMLDGGVRVTGETVTAYLLTVVAYAFIAKMYWNAATVAYVFEANLERFSMDENCPGNAVRIAGKGVATAFFVYVGILALGFLLVGTSDELSILALASYESEGWAVVSMLTVLVQHSLGAVMMGKHHNLMEYLYWRWSQSNK